MIVRSWFDIIKELLFVVVLNLLLFVLFWGGVLFDD
jgi:hypothetical protein